MHIGYYAQLKMSRLHFVALDMTLCQEKKKKKKERLCGFAAQPFLPFLSTDCPSCRSRDISFFQILPFG